jgi:hypothetical protein
MKFFSITTAPIIATLAIAAPVTDLTPAVEIAVKQDLVAFWQDI